MKLVPPKLLRSNSYLQILGSTGQHGIELDWPNREIAREPTLMCDSGYQTSFIYEIGLVELPEVRLIPKDFNPPKGLFKASSTSLNK